MSEQQTSKSIKVTVLAIHPYKEGQGSLKAFVSIQIGGVKFHECRLVQQAGQRAFVSGPQKSWDTEDGQTRYKALIEFPDTWKDAITAAVVEAFESEESPFRQEVMSKAGLRS